MSTVGIVPIFSDEIETAVLRHMNSDHRDDNLTIVRAFADRDARTATMTSFDDSAGYWRYTVSGADEESGESREIRLPWSGTISERSEIRREVVALHEAAQKLLTTP